MRNREGKDREKETGGQTEKQERQKQKKPDMKREENQEDRSREIQLQQLLGKLISWL